MDKEDVRAIVGTIGHWRVMELLEEAKMLVAVLNEMHSYLYVDDEVLNLIEAKGRKIGEKSQRFADEMRKRKRAMEEE